MPLNTIACSQIQFNNICDDLNKLGTKGYERLRWGEQLDAATGKVTAYFPQACERGKWIVRFWRWLKAGAWFQRTSEVEKATQLAYDFFRTHETFCQGHSDAIAKVLLIRQPNAELQRDLMALWQRVVKSETADNAAKDADIVLQATLSQAREKIGSEYSACQQKQNELVRQAQDQIAGLQAKRQEIIKKQEQEDLEAECRRAKAEETARMRLAEVTGLQHTIEEALKKQPLTAIRCDGGELVMIPSASLANLPFFNAQAQFHQALTEEDKRRYSQAERLINLTEWSPDCVRALAAPHIPELFKSRSLLLELYHFSHYLGHSLCCKECLDLLKEPTLDDSEYLFSSPSLPLDDPLMQAGIKVCVKDFRKLAASPSLSRVDASVLSEIVKSNDLILETEKELLDILEKWARGRASEKPLFEALEEAHLLEHVRFEHFTSQELEGLDMRFNAAVQKCGLGPKRPNRSRAIRTELDYERSLRQKAEETANNLVDQVAILANTQQCLQGEIYQLQGQVQTAESNAAYWRAIATSARYY